MNQDTLQVLLKEAVREVAQELIQNLLNLDREAFLHEHGGARNGYYPRSLDTSYGRLQLQIPRDRDGRYYPSFLQPHQRRTVELGEVATALYAAGLSQRKAAEVLSLLLGHRYTHATISHITDAVMEQVTAFRNRPLPEALAFVYLDGFYLRVLQEAGVEKQAVYVALGITPAGERRVLGFWLFPGEGALAWGSVLQELRGRGLQRVLLFITDGLPGMEEAIGRVYPGAGWQRCRVHTVRESLGQVAARERGQVAAELRGIYQARSRKEAMERLEAFRDRWGGRYPRVVGMGWRDSGALLAEYEPAGAADSGDSAGDQGAGSPVSQSGGGLQAVVSGVGAAGGGMV